MVRRHATHIVMHRRQHRYRVLRHIDTGEDARGLGNAWQPFVQQIGAKVLQVQHDVVLVRTAAASLIDLYGHRA